MEARDKIRAKKYKQYKYKSQNTKKEKQNLLANFVLATPAYNTWLQ